MVLSIFSAFGATYLCLSGHLAPMNRAWGSGGGDWAAGGRDTSRAEGRVVRAGWFKLPKDPASAVPPPVSRRFPGNMAG